MRVQMVSVLGYVSTWKEKLQINEEKIEIGADNKLYVIGKADLETAFEF